MQFYNDLANVHVLLKMKKKKEKKKKNPQTYTTEIQLNLFQNVIRIQNLMFN